MSLSTEVMYSGNSSRLSTMSQGGRRNRSYSDAHVHFATAKAESDACNKIKHAASYDNPPEVVTEMGFTSAASTQQHSGNRPRSKSESEPHHRRISHKKKYPHHQQRHHHHHLNYGRHSPPPLSSSPCCGKMWIRPMSARRGGVETHLVATSALGDRQISSFACSGGSPLLSHHQATSKASSSNEEAATILDGNIIKSKASSIESCTGLEDELTRMYTTSSSSPTMFGSSFSLAHHNSPTTPIAFGESGKPIIRVKNHHQDQDDLFESSFLPVNPTKKSGHVK